MGALEISSPVFEHNDAIPPRFTCKGKDINPALVISGIPSQVVTLALIMDDPDAPMGTWDHWLLWNIPPSQEIGEDSVPSGAVQGVNSWGRNDYGGPCPPSGTHRYFFKLYALDCSLDLAANSNKAALEKAMEGHILDDAELIGLFSKD